jgi:hypothetical protein
VGRESRAREGAERKVLTEFSSELAPSIFRMARACASSAVVACDLADHFAEAARAGMQPSAEDLAGAAHIRAEIDRMQKQLELLLDRDDAAGRALKAAIESKGVGD